MNVIYDLITHGGGDITSGQIICNNCEDAEIRYSCEMIENGDHVLDIGGNIGLHTVNFAKHLVPNGKLVAFEPMSKNYDVLCQNVKKHNLENNVLAINAAVSHESKQSQYIINPKNMGDCRGHVFENELFEEETVNQTTLDDFFANNNTIGLEWNKIKFIKMDTQGSEISILQGASNCFKEPFNGTIFLEYAPYWLHNNNQDINWFFDFIKEHMFSVFKIPLDSNVNNRPIVNPSSIEEIKDYYYECYQKDTYCNIVLKRTPSGPTRRFSITNAFTP
jgi:FkbM family methyltransferase|tara:strand:+ start:3742 stop:4572 length:831 start_codon:yes stop_codon:yes gene_type:complete